MTCKKCGCINAEYWPSDSKNCKECVRAYNRKYYKEHAEWAKAKARKERALIKEDVMQHYGGKCTCCGIDDIRFLNIDHIYGGGNKHRRDIGRSSGTGFYYWIRVNNYPEDFQVLCYNCNFGRAKHGGICPHKITTK